MPRRDDLRTILLIGSGPIVIGQACEFDYSGTQACKALRDDGYRVVLVNSNPATIMTDPETADRTYIEPLTWQVLEKVIAEEKPDAVLPTLGGQTALNLAMDLEHHGVLKKYGVEMIGARAEAIQRGEDREGEVDPHKAAEGDAKGYHRGSTEERQRLRDADVSVSSGASALQTQAASLPVPLSVLILPSTPLLVDLHIFAQALRVGGDGGPQRGARNRRHNVFPLTANTPNFA